MQHSKRTIKPGINTDIICKRCGHKVGRIRLRQRIKWKMVWQALGLALVFEFLANLAVYLIFR